MAGAGRARIVTLRRFDRMSLKAFEADVLTGMINFVKTLTQRDAKGSKKAVRDLS